MGGIEAHLSDLAVGLIRRGWKVAVICSTLQDIEPLRTNLRSIGADVYPVGEASTPWQLLQRTWRILRVLRRHREGVVHLHLQGDAGGLLVLVAARLAGCKAVVRTLHNPPVPPITRSLRTMIALTDQLVDRIVCVSPETRRAQLDEFRRDPRKLVVIANGVDVERFSPTGPDDGVRRELGLETDAEVVGTVARLQEERKGIGAFVEMAGKLASRRPNARFVIVGDGPLRTRLEAQADHLGLGQRVTFTGYRRDVPKLLRAMDVAVFPSSYEAAQYVMLEAMATALPVVLTPAGLAIDLVQPGRTGVLVRVGDVEGLTDAVDDVLNDRAAAARMGRAARQVIVEDYSTDAMVNALAGLYAELIDVRSRQRARSAGALDLR